jgi:energy-coupling factor transport system ATP-binding protein
MIQTRDLRYQHPGGVPALRGVDVDIRQGEWVAMIGANGSGKTTLARCWNALLRPTSGTVTVDGLSSAAPAQAGEIRRRVAMVFQHPDDQLVAPTVESEIAFGLENHGVDAGTMHVRVDEVLQQFDLSPYRHHPPHLLSGGERQRLAIASAVAVQPRYLVLDEPTALLDPKARRKLVDGIAHLWSRHGLSIVHITQSPEEAARAERVLVLNGGQLVDDGPPRSVFAEGARLRRMGLAAPFAVDAVEAAGGGATDALDLDGLTDWLVQRYPATANDEPSDISKTAPSGAGRLAARSVSHTYSKGLPTPITALRGVDLDVHAGRISGLVGGSGSGKTTLAQHLNGLLRPTHGRVCLDGEDIWRAGSTAGVRRQVGLVFQFPEAQLFEETVAEDVAFGPRNHGCDDEEAQQRAREALAAVGLPADRFGGRAPLSLSGGERRRAAIAGVLSFRPSIVVLDEPTAGLDPATEARIAALLGHLRNAGHGLLLISHDMDRIAELTTQLTVMEDGRVRCQGTTRSVFSQVEPVEDGIELPVAMRLTRRLRERGWHLPSLVTRAEALDYLGSLPSRRDTP